jgi:Lon protease-like protein
MPEIDKTGVAATPLFPLQAVLFPGGLLRLKVFEARYLDLIADCLRESRAFGVVSLRSGTESGGGKAAVELETVGTLAELIDVDSEQPNILRVRCRGTQRFALSDPWQRSDGLWFADTALWPDDPELAPSTTLLDTVRGLANAIAALKNQNTDPFFEPYRFDDAAWVANRWCEILPISRAAKQKLMELTDPTVRLQLVDDFLRSKGVVK